MKWGQSKPSKGSFSPYAGKSAPEVGAMGTLLDVGANTGGVVNDTLDGDFAELESGENAGGAVNIGGVTNSRKWSGEEAG